MYEAIPEELKQLKQWVCWKKVADEARPDKFKKVPAMQERAAGRRATILLVGAIMKRRWKPLQNIAVSGLCLPMAILVWILTTLGQNWRLIKKAI